MRQPTFFTRQDMERIAEQDINPALLPSDEIARQIEENDIHISVTINKQGFYDHEFNELNE